MKTSFVLILTILMGFTILSYFANFSLAANYYVDQNHPSASDANPGTSNSPWKTIQHAAETAVAGDTVFIRAGNYREGIYFDHNGNVTSGYIVFTAYPGEKPIIDGTGNTDASNGIVLDKAYIKLIGLEVANWASNAIWIEGAACFEIIDCEIHDVPYGVGVAYGSHDFVFNRTVAHHFDLYGFDVSPNGIDCYNGTFNDCISHTGRDRQQNVDGFALGHGTQHDFVLNRCQTYDVYDGFDISARNTTLNRCLAYDCMNGGYKLWQDNVRLINCIGYNSAVANVELNWDERPGRSTLMNCTFFDAKVFAIWIENAADTLHMVNCILAGGDNIGLAFEQTGVGNYEGDYNIFHNDTPRRAIAVAYNDEFSLDQVRTGNWTTYSGQDAHSLVVNSADSLFVNPRNFDLHLLSTSPAMDRGTPIGAPADDFEGYPRPNGAGYDIGAYEYHIPTAISELNNQISSPENLILYPNYPNPFNPSTTIEFALPKPAFVTLKVYNLLGEEVTTLVAEQRAAGIHKLNWYATGLASGGYLYRLEVDDFLQIKKMVLLR